MQGPNLNAGAAEVPFVAGLSFGDICSQPQAPYSKCRVSTHLAATDLVKSAVSASFTVGG